MNLMKLKSLLSYLVIVQENDTKLALAQENQLVDLMYFK